MLRMLKSALQLEKINKKDELTDDEVIAVIKKQVKIRKDSLVEYEKYQKNELISSLKDEIAVLSKYLPEELSEEKIRKAIDEVFEELNPCSIKDMGSVMKVLTSRIGTQADMSFVSKIVKEKLI